MFPKPKVAGSRPVVRFHRLATARTKPLQTIGFLLQTLLRECRARTAFHGLAGGSWLHFGYIDGCGAGDYIGTTVNLASRVTSTATAGQTVLTESVAEKLGDGAPIEPLGMRVLRGSENPAQLYRLAPQEERRDPACGRTVAASPAARLRQDDEELWFCSEECLRKFLTSTPSAA
jgi:hypothetical protein